MNGTFEMGQKLLKSLGSAPGFFFIDVIAAGGGNNSSGEGGVNDV